jgi:hypothetical protein
VEARPAERDELHRGTIIGVFPALEGASMSRIEDRGYAHPDKLVSTDWVAGHLNDPGVRLIESN